MLRETNHLFLRQSVLAPEIARWVEFADRVAASGYRNRPCVARLGAARPLHHPRSGLGHPGAPIGL